MIVPPLSSSSLLLLIHCGRGPVEWVLKFYCALLRFIVALWQGFAACFQKPPGDSSSVSVDVNPQRYTIACIAIVSFLSAREVNKKIKSQQKAYETKGISSFVTCGGDKLFVHVPRTWERNDCHAGYAHHAKRYQKLINDLIMSSKFTEAKAPSNYHLL